MTATEILREEVRHYIDDADAKSLRMVKAILEIEREEDTDEDSLEGEDFNNLPKELQMMIDEAIRQSDDGGGIPHEEVVAKYFSQWPKK